LLFVIGSIMYMAGAAIDYWLIGKELEHEADQQAHGVSTFSLSVALFSI